VLARARRAYGIVSVQMVRQREVDGIERVAVERVVEIVV
jgi:hypothetical protein